jgi:hypothetical protein
VVWVEEWGPWRTVLEPPPAITASHLDGPGALPSDFFPSLQRRRLPRAGMEEYQSSLPSSEDHGDVPMLKPWLLSLE